MGGAACVMKKLLRRRRGNTNGSGCDGEGLSGQSFIIVSGNGGTTAAHVYDHEQPFAQPLSPTESTYSPRPKAFTSSPQSPTISSPSPRSPTFSQSVFTRVTGKGHKMHQSINISAPILIPVEDRSQGIGSPVYASALSNSLTLSAAPSGCKTIHRRSLSADHLWAISGSQQTGELPSTRKADGPVYGYPPWKQVSMETLVSKTISENCKAQDHYDTYGTVDQDQEYEREDESTRELQPTNSEFHKSSIKFLSKHHSRTNTGSDWTNRNKRKTLVPKRRQSESNLLNKASAAMNSINTSTVYSVGEDNKKLSDNRQCMSDHGRVFDPTTPSMDYDTVQPDDRSLLSSVDILLMPSISSPTQYYDSPVTRKLIRKYLTSQGREFDEMIDYGFPAATLIKDDECTKVKTAADCRFLTLRLTLTPLCSREDESKLYETEEDDADKHAPIKEMVNKFLSRTSAILSCSPPRTISSVSPVTDAKANANKDRKSTVVHGSDSTNISTRGAMKAIETARGISPLQMEFSSIDASIFPNNLGQLERSPVKREDNGSRIIPPPKSLNRSRVAGPKKDRGFRIVDPSSLSSSPSTIRGVRSADFLKSDPDFFASPPSTPSPTAVFYLSQQQQLPRKGSLPALSLVDSVPLNGSLPEEKPIGATTFTATAVAIAPAIPPRRKASSPAILLKSDISATLRTSQHFQLNNNSNVSFQPLHHMPIMTSKSFSSSPPSPSPISLGSTPPIPTPVSKKSQLHNEWTGQDINDDESGPLNSMVPSSSPSLRGTVRNKRNDLSENLVEPITLTPTAKLTPRHDLMMLTTTTTPASPQEYAYN
ncbi:hypothetical protein BGX28_004591, partial [Mortierella sp. GBA30]